MLLLAWGACGRLLDRRRPTPHQDMHVFTPTSVLCLYVQGTCSTQAYDQLEQGECLLLNRNCSLPAQREAAQGTVSGADSCWNGRVPPCRLSCAT